MIITLKSYSSYKDAYGEHLKKNKNICVTQMNIFKSPKNKFQSKRTLILNESIAILKLILQLNKLRSNKIYCTGCHIATMLIFRVFNFFLMELIYIYIIFIFIL